MTCWCMSDVKENLAASSSSVSSQLSNMVRRAREPSAVSGKSNLLRFRFNRKVVRCKTREAAERSPGGASDSFLFVCPEELILFGWSSPCDALSRRRRNSYLSNLNVEDIGLVE